MGWHLGHVWTGLSGGPCLLATIDGTAYFDNEGLAIHANGNVFGIGKESGTGNYTIRQWTDGSLAGTAAGFVDMYVETTASIHLRSPSVDWTGGRVFYISHDATGAMSFFSIKSIDISTHTITNIYTGSGNEEMVVRYHPTDGLIYCVSLEGDFTTSRIFTIDPATSTRTNLHEMYADGYYYTSFGSPFAITSDAIWSTLRVTAGGQAIFRWPLSGAGISYLAPAGDYCRGMVGVGTDLYSIWGSTNAGLGGAHSVLVKIDSSMTPTVAWDPGTAWYAPFNYLDGTADDFSYAIISDGFNFPATIYKYPC